MYLCPDNMRTTRPLLSETVVIIEFTIRLLTFRYCDWLDITEEALKPCENLVSQANLEFSIYKGRGLFKDTTVWSDVTLLVAKEQLRPKKSHNTASESHVALNAGLSAYRENSWNYTIKTHLFRNTLMLIVEGIEKSDFVCNRIGDMILELPLDYLLYDAWSLHYSRFYLACPWVYLF